MESKDIRWKQRFQNFERSLQYLEQALNIQQPDIIQEAGLIHFFEMSFELAWNVVKDYLEEQAYDEATVDMIETLIDEKYYPLLKQLYDTFNHK